MLDRLAEKKKEKKQRSNRFEKPKFLIDVRMEGMNLIIRKVLS